MGPGEAIAAVAFCGTLIALLCVAGTSFSRWVAYRERKLEVEAETNRLTAGERGDYVELLEERVRVLERIATDRGQDIAHQIESLRDLQVEAQAVNRSAAK
jgi:hypothetical protein